MGTGRYLPIFFDGVVKLLKSFINIFPLLPHPAYQIRHALKVEIWEVFDFGHEVNIKELRWDMNKLLKDTDEKELRIAVNHVEGNRRTFPLLFAFLYIN